jgi:hypothetical protein
MPTASENQRVVRDVEKEWKSRTPAARWCLDVVSVSGQRVTA